MPTSTSMVAMDLVADLKAMPVSAMPTIALTVGALTLGDGLGGFYRFNAASTAAEDTRFFNVVTSNMTSTGRWLRVFQRIRVVTNGYLVMNGGFKSFFTNAMTNSLGQVTVYLTDDGTATGNPMFTEVWTTQGDTNVSGADANNTIIGAKKSLSNDLKVLTYQFVRGGSTTLTGVLGLVIPGLTAAPAGTLVTLCINGI